MVESDKKIRLVGEFIKKQREAKGISQRALGALFNPPVTTQFISNVERGVTPLPPIHIATLATALAVSASEITALLEKEYAMKLNGRVGQNGMPSGLMDPQLHLAPTDFEFMKNLYEAYRSSDFKVKQAFFAACESILKVQHKS